MGISRRDAFSALIGSAATAAAVGAMSPNAAAAPAAQKLPWKYVPLDPDATADRAYQGHWRDACMYGVFESIIGQLGEKFGEPYASFPFRMMRYGLGGVMRWGTLCGALNGAAAAASLVSPDLDAFVHEVFSWYEQMPLPEYVPEHSRVKVDPMPRSTAHSTLCHVSVTRWTVMAKARAESRARLERCARISASVARHAVLVLNAQHAGTFRARWEPLPETERCRTCHAATRLRDKVPVLSKSLCNVDSEMACGACHKTIKTVSDKHPLDVKPK